jgi:hypothetical protein
MRMGFGLGLGIQQRVTGENYTAEAQAYFLAMATQPSNAIKTVQNNLIVSLKNDLIYSKLDNLQLYYTAHTVGADTLINVINPLQRGSLVNAGALPTFAAKAGWTTKTAGYIRTGYNPSAVGNKFEAANCSYGLILHTFPVGTSDYELHATDGTNYIVINPINTVSGVTTAFIGTAAGVISADINGEAKKYFCITRNTTDGNKICIGTESTFTRGANNTAIGVVNIANEVKDIFIGAINNNGTRGNLRVTYPAIFFAGSGMTEAEWGLFRTHIGTYIAAMAAL